MQKQQEVLTAKSHTQSGIEDLPDLFSRLGDQTVRLLEAKFNLLTVEVKEDAASYARNAIYFGIGAIITGVGLALLNVALALFVAALFTFADAPLNYALGFVATGFLYLVIGGIIVTTIKNRVAAQNPLPERTIEELRKDKQWLMNE